MTGAGRPSCGPSSTEEDSDGGNGDVGFTGVLRVPLAYRPQRGDPIVLPLLNQSIA